jgi:hypothetical protein
MKWETIASVSDGEEVEMKGFLFQAPEGYWILSKEPNLKSCCIGASHKHDSQITLFGNFAGYSDNLPLRIRGIVHHKPSGMLLSEATVIQGNRFPYGSLGVLALCLVLCSIKLKRLLLP